MPPRPFPFPIQVGTDICRVTRIRNLLSTTTATLSKDVFAQRLAHFLNRIMTPSERRVFWRDFKGIDPVYAEGKINQRVLLHLAGRFAAKEAVIKAVKPRSVGFQDITVLRTPSRGVCAVINDAKRLKIPSTEPEGPKSKPSVPTEDSTKREAVSQREAAPASSTSTEIPSSAEAASPTVVELSSPKAEASTLSAHSSRTGLSINRYAAGPSVVAAPNPLSELESLEGQIARLSISHDGDYATAVCIAVQEANSLDVDEEDMAGLEERYGTV